MLIHDINVQPLQVSLMDVLILCGGFAKRLEPISLFIPKQLLPIRGRPLIDYIVDNALSLGANKIVVSTNKRFSDQYEYWLANKKCSGTENMQLVIEPTLNNNQKFGAIRGIENTIRAAKLKDDLLVVAGDNFFDFSLLGMAGHFEKSRKPTICAYDVGSLESAKNFGVLNIEGDVVKKFNEKPENPESTLISTGIYLFPKDLLNEFGEYLKDGNNPDAPGYFIKYLVSKHEVHAVIPRGNWYDIGTLDAYNKVCFG